VARRLLIGRYRAADLQFRGLADRDLSSLRVQPGYQLTLYKEDDFAGEALVRTADDACLVGRAERPVRSLVVDASTRPDRLQDCTSRAPRATSPPAATTRRSCARSA